MLGDVIMVALTHEVIHMVSMLPPKFIYLFIYYYYYRKNLFLQI
jgi:GT2 family glycosyltransferase